MTEKEKHIQRDLHSFEEKGFGCVYIYTLSHPITDDIRYVGKTNSIGRRYNQHIKNMSGKHKSNWVKCLAKQGLMPKIDIIDTVNDDEWQFWEKYYISLYRSWGFNLTNATKGGDGVPFTKETIEQGVISRRIKTKEKYIKRFDNILKKQNTLSEKSIKTYTILLTAFLDSQQKGCRQISEVEIIDYINLFANRSTQNLIRCVLRKFYTEIINNKSKIKTLRQQKKEAFEIRLDTFLKNQHND